MITQQRPGERSEVQVLEFDQHLSTFTQQSNVELCDAGAILRMRVRAFRIRIARLRHGSDDIDLFQCKRQVGRPRCQTSDQAGGCLQGAVDQTGMKNILTKITFQMLRYFQLRQSKGTVDVKLLDGLEGRPVMQAVFSELI